MYVRHTIVGIVGLSIERNVHCDRRTYPVFHEMFVVIRIDSVRHVTWLTTVRAVMLFGTAMFCCDFKWYRLIQLTQLLVKSFGPNRHTGDDDKTTLSLYVIYFEFRPLHVLVL